MAQRSLQEEPIILKEEFDVCKFCDEKNTCVDPCCVKLVEKQEPITDINFEQELYKAFGQVKDFTLGMQIAKRFYEMGKQHQEPVSEDLEEAIDTYLATYFGGEKEKQDWPFLKKMAIHFANWQKQQTINKAYEWIEEINNHHHIMRYSDSCEPPLSELTEWFKNYMKGE